jgi:ABC-type lipoprotein export system ATPase subunit
MIRFKELIPSPLAGTDLSDSGLWACKEQHLATSSSYLIHSPSGKGKSTFLSILYGIRKDWVGEVSLFEKEIQTYSENEWEELRRQQLSYVFQGLRLFPNLSAMDNIQLKNSLSDFKSEHEIKQMAQVLEVDALLPKPVAKLSFGQQQRVAIIEKFP